jgi:hypothetical protein
MSLHVAAQHLASKGRKGDTELVHMTKGEIKGLQDLALANGGSLSINPDTGLVEASFLKRILPMVAGAALTGLSGGLINPFTASMIVGGFEGIRTGDVGKGLLAGLSAYGGGGIGQGIAGAAGSAATETAVANSLGVPASAGTVATGPGSQAAMLAAENASMGLTPAQSAANISSSAGYASGATTPSMFNTGNSLLRAGAQRIMDDPVEGAKAAYKAMPTGTIPAVGSTIASAMTPTQEVPELKQDPSSGKYISEDFQAYVPAQPNPYYRPRGLGYTGYAEGGMVDPMQRMPNGGLASIQGMRDGYDAMPTMDGNIPQFKGGGKMSMKEVEIKSGIFKDTNPNTANLGAAEAAEYYVSNAAKKNKVPYAKMPKTNMESLGGIEVGPLKRAAMGGSIGGYSDGGRMLKGPGDGMSDSIPGVIGSKQPARLADGEFVVPADVVSHLGNGSTDAGAKRLYAMMDKVRKARTGNKKQGKQIKPEKYMPA